MADESPTCCRSSWSPPTGRCGPARRPWSLARTTDGEVGILPHHAPLLGTSANGAVLIRQESATRWSPSCTAASCRWPTTGSASSPRRPTWPRTSTSPQAEQRPRAGPGLRRRRLRPPAASGRGQDPRARHGSLAAVQRVSGAAEPDVARCPRWRRIPMSLIVVLDVLAALVALALLALGLLVLRRRVVTRSGGTFDCSLRLGDGSTARAGCSASGATRATRLEWYRVFSYSMRPRRVLSRRDLQVVDRRDPHGAEVFSLLVGRGGRALLGTAPGRSRWR